MFAGVVKRIITMVTAAEMLQESLALLFVFFCSYADMKSCSLIAKMVASLLCSSKKKEKGESLSKSSYSGSEQQQK